MFCLRVCRLHVVCHHTERKPFASMHLLRALCAPFEWIATSRNTIQICCIVYTIYCMLYSTCMDVYLLHLMLLFLFLRTRASVSAPLRPSSSSTSSSLRSSSSSALYVVVVVVVCLSNAHGLCMLHYYCMLFLVWCRTILVPAPISKHFPTDRKNIGFGLEI